MKMMKGLMIAGLMALGVSANAELPAQIECTTAQKTAISAETAHRSLLSGGAGYGFCVADSCDPSLDLVGGKCVAKPTPKWISTANQSVVEGDYDVVLRASLPHASMDEGGATFALSSGASTATEDDFTLSSQSVHFAQGSVVSDPLIVHLHRRPGYQAPREIQLTLNSKTLSIAITDSERAQALAYTAPIMSTTEGETVEMEISFNQVLSQLFPTKVKVQVGDQTISALVPARKDKVTVSVEATSQMVGPALAVSVAGMDGTEGSLTVGASDAVPADPLCGQPADPAADPFHATVQHDFQDGNGLVEAKLVCSKAELQSVSMYSPYIVIGADIDLGYDYGIEGGAGNPSRLDGQNHTIKNCSLPLTLGAGCLGGAISSNGHFKDFTLENVYINGVDGATVGAVVGTLFNDSSIKNVTVRNASITTTHYVGGGIVGSSYGLIDNCVVSDSSISAAGWAGQIVGLGGATGTVTNSSWINVSLDGGEPLTGP